MSDSKACYQVTESFLPLAAVSAITRRSICHTPIGDTAMTHRRLWNDT
ncbi:MAG: hypothetical protein IJR07_10605 [Bacteroidaceae bacterium]|nr:hypothetical protein [Bacteroidaceae bacterium]